MNFKFILIRLAIFAAIYPIIIGVPIWAGYKTESLPVALSLMFVLASLGPLALRYLRRRAELMLLEEHYSYHMALKELAVSIDGMSNIDDILRSAVEVIGQNIRPKYSGIYALDPVQNVYRLKYANLNKEQLLPSQIPADSEIVKQLSQKQTTLFAKDIKDQLPYFGFHDKKNIFAPCFVKNLLYSFLVIGPKYETIAYNKDDLGVFQFLSNHISYAIEKILLKEDKLIMAEDELARRHKALDHLSASMAHEIDNPIFAIMGTAEMIKMAVNEDIGDRLKTEELTYLNDRLERVISDSTRISKMIKAVREFSAKGTSEFKPVKLAEVIEGFLCIVWPQFKYEGIIFSTDIDHDIIVFGNKVYLEEVLVNITLNAIHAVKYSQVIKKSIKFKVYKDNPDTCLIEMKDNGYGIKDELLEDIFLDFVTTKASTDGTGIGLSRVRKIVKLHKGKVWAKSEGESKGAAFFVQLPLYRS